MLGCKPAETPMDTTVKLEESDGSAPVDKGRYQHLVGKLIYLSHTRPDIGLSVSMVSQFMNNPTEKHMIVVTKILRYLKMTPGKGLFFQRTIKKEIEIFSYADWVGSVTDRRSISSYCSFVWGTWLHGEARNSQWYPIAVLRPNFVLWHKVSERESG